MEPTTSPLLDEQALLAPLLDLALDRWTLILAGVIFGCLRFAMRFVHSTNKDRTTAIMRRLLPLMPEFIGVIVAVSGGIPKLSGQPILIKIAVGLWAAYISQKIHKVLGQTILADDVKLETATAKARNGHGGNGDANSA